MLKKTTKIFLMTVMCVALAGTALGVNLLDNPGFEDATIAPWLVEGSGPAPTIGINTSVVKTGSQSGEINFPAEDGRGIRQILALDPADRLQEYKISCSINADNYSETLGVELRISENDGFGNFTYHNDTMVFIPSPSSDWVDLSYTATLTETDTTELHVVIALAPQGGPKVAGDCMIDDVVFKKTVPEPTLVASAQETVERDAVVQLVSPKDGETVYMPHPHFRWQKEAGADIEDRYRVQISRDEQFGAPVVDDSLDVVSRLVCAKPLSPGKYFWRVRREDQARWSKVFRFTRGDSKEYRIKDGATQQDIAAAITEAAANTPAKVTFAQGDYRITDTIPLRRVRDLIIDGNGSSLTLETKFLDLRNCADITACNMTVRPAREPSTHVDVLAADPAAGTLTVQVKPGFPEHFPSYFRVAQRGNTIMRVVDEVNRGRSITGWGSGGGKKRIEELGERRYRIHGLPASNLENIRPGMTAYAKSYGPGFGYALHTTRLTLSKVTFLGMSGSIWGDREMNANSCFSCGFLPLSPEHYTGASGVIGNGRIGSWFEDCRFEMGADDNVMDHVFPWPVDNIRGNVAILKNSWMWPQDIRKGDEFVLWDCMNGEKRRATRVTVLEVQDADGSPMVTEELNFRVPRRLVLSKNTMELNLELGRPEGASFQSPGKTSWGVMDSMLLIRLSPNNQDFVFRRNEVIGGSAGMLNNTTRALVAENTFRNLRGSAVHAGFRSAPKSLPVEGCGSRDYVIRDNKMENCGTKAIRVDSDAGIGGNIIIKNNTISYSATMPDTVPWWAITVVGNNDGVVVKDNLFKSAKPPSRGSWINSCENDHAIHHSNNRVDPPHPGIPMLREQRTH